MKNDDPLSDLEARLRAWRPAEVPAALRTRLLAAESAQRRKTWRRHVLLAGACALAVAALLIGRAGQSPDDGDSAVVAPSHLRPAVAVETSFEPHWVLAQNLTMNIDIGVSPGIVPAALRLDEKSVAASGWFPVRSTDGKLPLKVDCQF